MTFLFITLSSPSTLSSLIRPPQERDKSILDQAHNLEHKLEHKLEHSNSRIGGGTASPEKLRFLGASIRSEN